MPPHLQRYMRQTPLSNEPREGQWKNLAAPTGRFYRSEFRRDTPRILEVSRAHGELREGSSHLTHLRLVQTHALEG